MFSPTSLFRIYARYRNARLASTNPASLQEKELLKLVKKSLNTRFAKDHNFKEIKSVSDYQKLVPLRKYEDFWEQYWKPVFPNLTDCTWPGKVPFFCVSSGTSSGKTKYIPYTKDMIKSNTKAGLDVIVHHLTNRPKSKILDGKNFILGGSTDLVEEAKGIFSGDLSGIAVKTLPTWIKPMYFPPEKVALIKNWEEKVDTLARLSLKENIRMLSGVPSWLIIFINKLREIRPDSNGKLAKLYPNLEMLLHGGVNFAPYRSQFNQILDGSKAELREVYPASEGFIAVADKNYTDGMRLNCDHSIFFEFIPLDELESPNPTRHWIANIEKEINYAVVMTTAAGLWSYIIGDTVKFLETNPPRLLVTGRTSYYLSAFGEHLTGEEIDKAISHAAEKSNISISDYSVGALYPTASENLGGHLIVIECSETSTTLKDPKEFSEVVTSRLSALNEDYEAHLAGGYGLRKPDVLVAKKGMFTAWMKKRGKLGGQNKVPRIISDQELFTDLREFAESFSADSIN